MKPAPEVEARGATLRWSVMGALPSLALAVAPSLAAAQDTPPAVQLQPVTVVGTMPLQSIGTPLTNVPANVQVGSGQQIDQQRSLNLADYLDSNLGSINTSNSVGNPYQLDVSYRGFTASPVLGTAIGMSVFVDGVRVNEAFGDIVNWDLIPTNAIAGINLIPGSNPLFGLNTLGGAIAVNTKNGESSPGLKATAYGGSFGRRAFEAEYGSVDTVHDTDLFIAANFFHEDGRRDYSRSNVNTLFGKERWHDASTTLELSLSLADNTLFGPSVLPVSMLDNPTYAYTAPDYNENRNTLLALKGSHYIDDTKLIEGNVYYRLSRIVGANSNASCDDDVAGPENCVANQANGDLDASNVVSNTHQRSFGTSVQLSLLGDVAAHKNRFVAGASVDTSKVDYTSNNYGANLVGEVTYTIDPAGTDAINQTGSNPYFQGGTALTARSNNVGLFASDNFAFNEQWNMTLAGRYDYSTEDLHGQTVDGDQNLVGLLNGNHDYHRFNPAVGLNFNPVKDLTFYGGYNEGMRVPSPVELSCADPATPCALPTGFTSDPDLKMIVSKTWEAGARGKFASDFGWSAAVYNTENDNDIQFISNGANNGVTGFFQNVGQTRRRGFELGVNGHVKTWTFSANYGFVDATYQSAFIEASPQNSTADANGNISVNKGDRIPGIARQNLKLRIGDDITAAWNVGATVIATAGQYPHGDENNQDSNGMLGGYTVVNIDSHYQLAPRWNVFLKVNNLFDKDFHTFGVLGQNMYTAMNELAVVPSAPRGIWVGVTYAFGGGQDGAVDVN